MRVPFRLHVGMTDGVGKMFIVVESRVILDCEGIPGGIVSDFK